MFKTRVTRLLGIEYPILQGGMQWVARAELASAVSNAGGLGTICSLSFGSSEGLRAEIKKTKDLTDKPFAVNLTFLPTLHPVDYGEYIDTVIDEGVKIVETAGRSPEQYLPTLKAAGIKVIHKCTAVRFAKTAERIGCDAVSIDGFEAAGHPGEEDVTSLILVPATAAVVKIPIIASGGFADGRGLVAASALGAEAMNMGTRFLATQEAAAHPNIKEWLIEATERDAMLLLRSLRNTLRTLRNPVAEQVLELEKKGAGIEEIGPLLSGQRGVEQLKSGDLNAATMTAGQVVGLIQSIPTAKELIDAIIAQAKEYRRTTGQPDHRLMC